MGGTLAVTTPGVGAAYASEAESLALSGLFPWLAPTIQAYEIYIQSGSALNGIAPSNITAGTLSAAQKQVLVQAETDSLVAGGADPATAAAQANSDVTAALTAEGADPSQDDTAIYLAGIITIVAVGLYIWKALP